MKKKILSILFLFLVMESCYFISNTKKKERKDDSCFLYKGQVFNKTVRSSNVGTKTDSSVVVPNAKSAFILIEPILYSKYGRNQIRGQFPLQITLYDDSIWFIEGTKNNLNRGGVVHASINKKDGKIILVSHGE